MHLPQVDLTGEGLSLRRLTDAARAARDSGFAAVSANDHLHFSRPWLDGPTALAAVVEHSGGAGPRHHHRAARGPGPAPARQGAGRPGRALGRPGGRRHRCRLLGGRPRRRRVSRSRTGGAGSSATRRCCGTCSAAPPPRGTLEPGPVRPGGIPLWLASWGSPAGLRRVARLGDGWLASAYHTDPERFAADRALLAESLRRPGRHDLPAALATMWTCVTEDRAEADRVVRDVLAPMLVPRPRRVAAAGVRRPRRPLRRAAGGYAAAGCARVHLWPVGDEPRQLRLIAERVLPRLDG